MWLGRIVTQYSTGKPLKKMQMIVVKAIKTDTKKGIVVIVVAGLAAAQ